MCARSFFHSNPGDYDKRLGSTAYHTDRCNIPPKTLVAGIASVLVRKLVIRDTADIFDGDMGYLIGGSKVSGGRQYVVAFPLALLLALLLRQH